MQLKLASKEVFVTYSILYPNCNSWYILTVFFIWYSEILEPLAIKFQEEEKERQREGEGEGKSYICQIADAFGWCDH